MVVQTLPTDLLNEELKLSMLLQRYRPVTITETSKALNEALDNIQLQLIKTEDLTQRARLLHLERQITQELSQAYAGMSDSIKKDMQDVSETAYTASSNSLLTHGAVALAYPDLPKNAINAMVDMNELMLLDGKGYKISDFVTNQSDSHIKRFKQIVAGGLAEGANYSTIARRLKEVNQSVKSKDLKAIASTVVAEARGRGQAKAYSVASNSIIGWKSDGTLDSRTSFRCASLDGKVWLKSQGWTQEKLLTNNYWYPRHFNCRTVVIAQTKYSAQMDKDRTRAMNGDERGQTSAKTTFQDFFDSQSDELKKDYLGKSRYELYKDNKLKIKDFVDIKTGREYTIQEIKDRL